MIKRILQSVVFVLLACALSAGTVLYAQDPGSGTIIIQPDPVDKGGSDEDETAPPAPIAAGITVNPETLNLSSNIKFITVYITLAESNVEDILTETVKITRAAGESVEPIYALAKPTGIEDNELMVKFSADEVKAVLTQSAELNLVIAGELADGTEFEGTDSFRTIGNYIPASERKNFRYKLKGNITDGAKIIRARVVMNYASKNRAHLLNAKDKNGKWSGKLNRQSRYSYLPADNGEKYEWEVTPAVSSRWENGEEYVEIVIDYDSSEVRGQPQLVVTYSDGTVQTVKNAEPVGPEVTRDGSQGKVKLYYTGEDAARYKKGSLKIYGWNTITKNWEAVTGTVNDGDNSLSTADTTYPKYTIMSVNSAAVETTESKNSLGQNYPNPFNPGTTIKYSLDNDAHVTMTLYNVRGQKVATIVNEYKTAGSHSVYFGDGEKLSRGVYYYQIRAGDFVSTKRMVVLH